MARKADIITSRLIALPRYRFDRHGKLVKAQRRQSVSDKLRQKKSKRVRVAKRTAAP